MSTTPRSRRWASIERRLDAAKETLRALVAVNSFTRNRDGVAENARLVEKLFAPLGFEPEYIPSSDPGHGEHLVLSRRGRDPAGVALVSHLDTVYPPEIERKHAFVFREEGDTIYGPGVADIKGGTVLMHLALTALAECEPDAFDAVSWSVLLNAAEEEGSPDFPSLLRDRAAGSAVACLVFEHGSDGANGSTLVTTSRRGSARFEVVARGRPAHAGSAHGHGISAIRELARVVERVESMTANDGSVTFNVGRIEGGLGSNTVPDHALCDVDLRADDPERYARAVAAIEELAGPGSVASREDGRTGSIVVERGTSYPPWARNGGSEALLELARLAGIEAGLDVGEEHRLGASDGSHVWSVVPTLDGLGPIGHDLHSAVHDPDRGQRQESLRWSSMGERTHLAAALLSRLARGERPA